VLHTRKGRRSPQNSFLALAFSNKTIKHLLFLALKEPLFAVLTCIDRKCFMLIHMITWTAGITMAKCPTCGKEVKNATKTWKMAGKPDKKGKRTQLTIALYKCCDKTFREVVDKKKI
jgi:hypothetical protein